MQPLHGIKVLDFSTLLPGPLCTLMLAEAGAEVIKVERADGDEMRSYVPRFGSDSVNFALLNRGKKSVCADLKQDADRRKVLEWVKDADVVVEQFRPGVMGRLGLDYGALAAINPRLIYCSITAYGQHGPKALNAAHDLNFQADTGMLGLTVDHSGAPVLPPALTGDLAGGAYPAVMNILLALRQRDLHGKGSHLDISMTDNLFTLMYWGLGNGWAAGQWPRPGSDLVTGGTARYGIYRTADDRYLAAAPLENRFWSQFVSLLGAPELHDYPDNAALKQRIADLIAAQPLSYWCNRFDGHDVCTVKIVSLEEAVRDPHFVQRGVFDRTVRANDGRVIPALPTPVCQVFRSSRKEAAAPQLGENTDEGFGVRANLP